MAEIPQRLFVGLYPKEPDGYLLDVSEVSGDKYTRQPIAFDDDWEPDLDVSCNLPDLRPLALTLLGAAVIMAALVVAVAQRVRRGKA